MCKSALANLPQTRRLPLQANLSTTVVPIQRSISHQFEHIYLSSTGELLGAHIIIAGTTLFADTTGRLSLLTRDYTAELDYDYRGKLNRIGRAEIVYDYIGRTQQIGSTLISYDYRGQIDQIGNASIEYTTRGKVTQIGDVTVQYDRNLIETISSNYTSAGARVIVVNQRRESRRG